MENKEVNEQTPEEFKDWQSKENKKQIIKEIIDWVRTIAIGIIVGVLLVVFVIQRDDVRGESMEPNLYDGYIVFTEKICTYFDNFHRGDIVVLDGADMEGYNHEEYLIKRVVGLPGETIRIADGAVYIREVGATEFYKLDEPYLEPGVSTMVMSIGLEKGYDEITLGEDEYYCMGDNRPVSNDSRTLGPFSANRLKGRAAFIAFPIGAIRLL